jgi:hypothetical protein
MPNDPSLQLTAHTSLRVGEDPTLASSLGAEVVFELMVATMWSVGELNAVEVERSRAAVAAMGLHPSRGGSAFGTIAAGALPFEAIAFDRLSPAQQRLAYAAAEWIAATSVPSDRRRQFMRGLRLRLRLTDLDVAQLSELAHAVDAASDTPRDAFARLLAAIT